ncbi:hypothetical protein PtA15_11A213 [Puccinia triticina]|uniref:Transcription initiation factor TFIID subunit 2 n=1 Tax=Puccinia triticina TaxID=208348 RepID=A0ABY7CW71_9BASI|nr:uncharacterized protein PtA15_11A213 [Puccinia triticina]WAQ89524.1 hypothetical protein PtA15_11A213 [Puccinia triticina]
MSSATHSIGATFNSATLTLYPADLLYPAQLIDQVLKTKPIPVQSLANQWIGINIIPKAPSDTWLINGLSLYITGLYFKAIWGTNDYRYWIKKEIIKCVESDVDKPPICQPGCHCRGGTSLGLSRVIPKIFLPAISGEMRDNMLSTSSFLRIFFQVTAYFNRKKLTHELTLRQLNRSKQYYQDDWTTWAEKRNVKPVDRFEGQMSNRIQECDGIPYEHVLDIKEPFKRYELPSNHKNEKFKRSSRRYASSNQAPADLTENSSETFTYPPWERSQEERDRWKVRDWMEEEDLFITQSNVEWIHLDVEVEWICDFRFEMKEFMWLEQLQRDRNVVAQLQAVKALKTLPSKIVSSHLCRVVLIPESCFRIRVEAVLALVSCANIEPDSPWNIRAIPKPNQFNNFADYFIRKAIVVALSHVRDQTNNLPSVCHQFFLDQLVYNNSSLNAYSDAHYIATTIGSMTDSLIHLANNGGREQLGEIFGTKALSTGVLPDLERTCDKRALLMINKLERFFMADRLVPSYCNLITMTVIEFSATLVRFCLIRS